MSAIVITGASGFLGRHLIAHFLGAGRDVIALTRNPAALDDVAHARLRVVATDYGESIAEQLARGCSLIHLAAQRNMPSRSAAAFTQANIAMPERLARAAIDRGVGRFIHVSSALALGSSAIPLDATAPLNGRGSAYVDSRVEGLLAVERIVGNAIPLITLLPAIIYGPDHPRAPNRITAHIRRVLRAPVRIGVGFPSQRRNLVFVDDVIRAIARAEAVQSARERRIISGENVTQDELERHARAAAGKSAGARIVVPGFAALAVTRMMDAMLRFDPSSGWTARTRTLLAPWCLVEDAAATPFAAGVRRTVEAVQRTSAA